MPRCREPGKTVACKRDSRTCGVEEGSEGREEGGGGKVESRREALLMRTGGKSCGRIRECFALRQMCVISSVGCQRYLGNGMGSGITESVSQSRC